MTIDTIPSQQVLARVEGSPADYRLDRRLELRRHESWTYEGRDLKRRRNVLIRILRTVGTLGRQRRERVLDLRGGNLVRYLALDEVRETGTKARFTYAVRPLLGHPLSIADLDSPALDADTSWHVIEDVLKGLIYLHAHDFVHGDLRPANIFITDKFDALLADFVLAPPVSFPFRGATNEDEYKQLEVELGFLAPEAFQRLPIWASDMYSFGKIAAWLGVMPPNPLAHRVLVECTALHPALRPSADTVHDILFNKGLRTIGQVKQIVQRPITVQRAVHDASRRLRSGMVTGTRFQAGREVRDAAAVLEKQLRGNPELAYRLRSPQTAANYLASVVVLGTARSEHGDDSSVAGSPLLLAEDSTTERTTQPDVIDREWQDRIYNQVAAGVSYDLSSPEYAFLPQEMKDLLLAPTADPLATFRRRVNLANEARAAMLAQEEMLYSEEVAALVGNTMRAEEVRDLQRAGQLLAVRDHGRLLYPAFQFGPNGRPYGVIADVNRVLYRSDSGWGVLSWWQRPHVYLDDQPPKMVISRPRLAPRIVGAATMSVTGHSRSA